MTAQDYLASLIDGIKMGSETPIQLCELELLMVLINTTTTPK